MGSGEADARRLIGDAEANGPTDPNSPTGPTGAVAIAGGAGYIGAHIARALADRGIASLALTRDDDRARRLAAGLDDARRALIHPVRIDLASDDARAELAAAAQARGLRLIGGAAALGGWWEGGRLVDVPRATWTALAEGGLTSHVDAARAIVPLLPAGSRYILMAGIAASRPIPASGPISITGAAQRMLARVLAREHRGDGIEVLELALLNPVVDSPADGRRQYPGEPVLLGSAVGRRVCAELLAPPAGRARRMLRSMGRIPPGDRDDQPGGRAIP